MLKTVSSITNAIGALNYKGTWNASTNTPALASGTGTKGDYYQVSVAGSTALDGISNWGVGDVAAFNGTTWQRIEGGADLNGVNLSVSGTSTLSALTASTALALDANKNVVSVTNTGTGNNVLASGPTLSGNPVVNTSIFQDNTFSITANQTPSGNFTRLAFAEGSNTVNTGLITSYGSVYGGSPSRNYAMTLGTQGAERLWLNSTEFRAMADNAYDLGNASYRWKEVYAVAPVINTSDARTKQQVRDLNDAERLVAQKIKGMLKAFKFNDSVDEKGENARIHFGVIAQDVAAAFASEGLDASKYALFCHDSWEDQYEFVWATRMVKDEETGEEKPEQYIAETRLAIPAGDRYGIRYGELLAFMIAAL
jgi:hypothetical protein